MDSALVARTAVKNVCGAMLGVMKTEVMVSTKER